MVLAMVPLVSGCAVKRIENGVYHSSKGYRVAIPNAEWTLVDEGPADLSLRHRASAAGMAVNATCDGGGSRRTPEGLARQLHLRVRGRRVLGGAVAAGHG